MDKKSAKYNQQSANKSATPECKKNQDVINGKTFPKAPRRREPPGANGYPKNEQSRKSGNYQKARNFDKRPKPKGQYYGGPKEDSKVVDEEVAEYGSVMAPGSKKQNLNHLLNFHYEARSIVHNGSNNYGRSNHYNNHRWLPPVQQHKYNKELFLQANCQFVVSGDGDYSVQLVDPDILVDWKLIEQIRIFTPESLSCPICLFSPVAGKMTRCGHVYCWPCILHYLSLSDKHWRNCPICYEFVCKSDLKSVVQINQQQLNIGDTVTLRLMRRKKGSLLAVPVGANITDLENFLGFSDEGVDETYSKLLRAEIRDIVDIIETERVQLKFELNEDAHTPESCFIEQALVELTEREEKLAAQITNKQENMKLEKKAGDFVENNMNDEVKSLENAEKSVENIQKLISNDETLYNINEKWMKNGEKPDFLDQNPSNQSKFFYFYQAEGGQHMYLHAMNVKMLELQYGDLEHSPHTVTGKILEKETGSLTEELRKRMRYLCHLPLTCTFDIAEIEMTTPIVSQDVLYHFKDQLEMREQHRKRRERDEKKREKKITAEENKKMGKFPTPNVHIESHKHFPRWQNESSSSSMTVSTPLESVASSSLASSPSHSTLDEIHPFLNETILSSPSENDQGPSFAQMLRNDRMTHSTKAWPSISTTAPLPTRKQNTAVLTHQNDEDHLQAPSHSQSFGDVLAAAFGASNIRDKTLPKGKNKKSKKKGKATLLFASGMTRTS